jgi:hypothetical protein
MYIFFFNYQKKKIKKVMKLRNDTITESVINELKHSIVLIDLLFIISYH